MRKIRLPFLVLLITIATASFGSAKEIHFRGKPVIGHTTDNSTRIWYAQTASPPAKAWLISKSDGSKIEASSYDHISHSKGKTAVTANFEGLQPGTSYQIKIEGFKMHKEYLVRTDQANKKETSFLLGSCSYIGMGMTKIFFPAFKTRIFESMSKTPADFMIWMGDNTYYFGSDYRSYDGMFRKQMTTRVKSQKLQKMMSRMPQYAIWDDHDYGWNNADASFPLKDTAFKVFEHFWPNPELPQRKNGLFYSFSKGDAEFFMLDCRYNKTPETAANATLWGKPQMQWLKQELKNSKASFKFITNGIQVLNPTQGPENCSQYPDERDELFDFIRDEKIEGVVFLTGDRHFTQIEKMERENMYTIYDFTCSALTSPHLPNFTLKNMGETTKPSLVEGTLLNKRNFGRITIKSDSIDPTCLIEVFKSRGKQAFTYEIKLSELQFD